VTVNGRAYVDHPASLHQVGALLDAKAVHTGRSAADHLRVMVATTGIGRGRAPHRRRRGRLIRHMSVDDFVASASRNSVFVRSRDDARLGDLLLADGIEVSSSVPGHLEVTGLTSDEIG
jgi:hypothetical protein